MVILALVLGCWNSLFKIKSGDGIYDLTKLYALDNHSVDVLFLGSSHAFENFNTGTLWDNYGIASYICGGSVQPMWNTYYYLKETLKTQSPKLIVVEGFCTVVDSEFADDSQIIKNNFGFRWSIDKINSLMISSPKEKWKDFFLEYTQYHTRYKELGREDFLANQGNPLYADWKGFGCNMVTTPFDAEDVSTITEKANLFQKTEYYYRATLELAQKEGIPVVVVIAPYARISTDDQKIFNNAADIASEYGIPFINCNSILSEIGIDYHTDAADGSHLNYKGNQKFTKYIGQYLIDHYDLSDRRGDKHYLSWERNAAFVREMIYDQELVDCEDLTIIVQKIKNPYYWVFISTNGTCNSFDKDISDFLSLLGITSDHQTAGLWYLCNNTVAWDSSMEQGELYLSTSSHDFHLKQTADESGTYTNSITIDNILYSKVQNGINIVVYDTLTEKVIDTIGLNQDTGYSIVR